MIRLRRRRSAASSVVSSIVMRSRSGPLSASRSSARLASARAGSTRFEAIAGAAPEGPRWRVETSRGVIDARSVIVATGGLSVPATGSDGAGLRWAERLGHTVHPTYAALAPIVASPAIHAHLSGVSLFARIRATRDGKTRRTEGGFLFTHRGYSGPAVLDLGPVAGATVKVAWGRRDAAAWDAALAESTGLVASTLATELPLSTKCRGEDFFGSSGLCAHFFTDWLG